MSTKSKLFAMPALLAAGAMMGAPVSAAPLPVPGRHAVAALGEMTAADHRYYDYRYRRGPGVGDVLTGVLIIGGIAAIANAATRASRDERYRERGYPPPPYRGDERGYDSRAIDRAVSLCVSAVEGEGRVASVNRVDRTQRGWDVTGAMRNGRAFTCSMGDDGRIERLDVDGRAVPYRGGAMSDRERPYDGDYGRDDRADEDRQYSDDRYAEARTRMDAPADAPPQAADGPQPAYPGGPLPGDNPEDAPYAPEAI